MPITMSELREKTKSISESFGKQLIEQSGWNGFDAGLAVLAYAVSIIANASCVADAKSDIDALLEIGKDIKESYPDFVLKVRTSL